MIPNPKSFDEMVAAMLQCEQTPGQSVYQHGQSVCQHFFDLVDHLNGSYTLPEGRWKLPDWLNDYKEGLLSKLHSEAVVQQYTTYHDCGKPYCRTEDNLTGKIHFPNHAEISATIWASVGGNNTVERLIRDDMVLHTASAQEIAQKCVTDWSVQDAFTLLLASLAEIHSNAKLFGGLDSVSFKVKWKNIDRRGRQVCKHYLGASTTTLVSR